MTAFITVTDNNKRKNSVGQPVVINVEDIIRFRAAHPRNEEGEKITEGTKITTRNGVVFAQEDVTAVKTLVEDHATISGYSL